MGAPGEKQEKIQTAKPVRKGQGTDHRAKCMRNSFITIVPKCKICVLDPTFLLLEIFKGNDHTSKGCLLYTSDAADEDISV